MIKGNNTVIRIIIIIIFFLKKNYIWGAEVSKSSYIIDFYLYSDMFLLYMCTFVVYIKDEYNN